MWLGIAVVLLVMWALGAFVIPVAGGLIHILIILAIIAVVVHFVTGRKVI